MMGTVSTVIRRDSASPSSLSKLPFLLLVCITALVFSVTASAQVTANFEDGGLDGWSTFGGGAPLAVSNSTDVANDGTHSLLVTGRSQTYQGPGINLTSTLVGGQSYVFKVAVRLSNSTPGSDNVNMTMLNTVNGTTGFANVSGGTVTQSGWTLLQGTFTVPASGVSSLILYVEDDSNATAQYYIDTFSITGTTASSGCSNPPDNSGFLSNFDDGTAQGWVGRGPAAVAPSTGAAHSGAYSLLVTGRTATWNGATKDITGKMCNGQQYWVEAWVKMAPGEPTTSMNLSLQWTDAANQPHYPGVANATAVSGGDWVRLKSKPYTFSGSYTNLQIYVQTNNNPNASYYIDDIKVVYLPPPTIENIPSIAQTYSGDFLVGFAAGQGDLLGAHGELAAKHYNSVTPGNDLKWDTTEPTEGNFNFGPGDNILNFAQAHNIKMRGHTFVWHNQVPNWVFQNGGVDMSTQPYSDANKALLLSRLKNHIDALINHYKDNIYVWDVVNEAIDDGNPANFRQSKWYKITVDPNNNPGYPEYMDDAFIYADQALKALGIRNKVELCYNDYNTTIQAKRDFIYNWVKGAIARGVPIDCVGNQFHNTINFPIDDAGSAVSKQSVIDTINLFSSLTATSGKPIVNEITEFDISLYRYGNCNQTFYTDYDDLLAGDRRDLALEGYRYRDYFEIFKSLKDKIDSVTIWGLGDDDSWLNPSSGKAGCNVTANDAPLPFDSYLQHKSAYDGIVDPWALPGAGLTASMGGKSGPANARVWTITLSNSGSGTAYGARITGFSLKQTSGAACTPVVTPPAAYPISFGDMSQGATVNAPFTIDFTGCPALARFTLNVTYDSSNGSNAHTLALGNQFR